MKKKLFLSLGALAMVMGIVACGGTSSHHAIPPSSTSSDSSVSTGGSTSAGDNYGSEVTDATLLATLKAAVGDLEGTYYKQTFTATDILSDRYDVRVNGELKAVVYKGHKDITAHGATATLNAYVGVDASTLTILGFEMEGNSVTEGYGADFTGFGDKFVGTDGNISDVVSGASVSSGAYKDIAKAAVAQAKADLGSSETPDEEFGEEVTDATLLATLKAAAGDLEGTYYKQTFTATDILSDRYDVRVNGELKAIVYKGHKDITVAGATATLNAYVGVDIAALTILDFEIEGNSVTDNYGFFQGTFEGFGDKFVGTDGNISDVVSGASVSSGAYKDIAKAAVAQAKIDANQSSEDNPGEDEVVPEVGINFAENVEENVQSFLKEAIASGPFANGLFTKNENFHPMSDVLTARYDFTYKGILQIVVYYGEMTSDFAAGMSTVTEPFSAYVGVRVVNKKIVNFVINEGGDDRFNDFEDAFTGTGGNISDTVAGGTVSADNFKTIAKAAVKQLDADTRDIYFVDEDGQMIKSATINFTVDGYNKVIVSAFANKEIENGKYTFTVDNNTVIRLVKQASTSSNEAGYVYLDPLKAGSATLTVTYGNDEESVSTSIVVRVKEQVSSIVSPLAYTSDSFDPTQSYNDKLYTVQGVITDYYSDDSGEFTLRDDATGKELKVNGSGVVADNNRVTDYFNWHYDDNGDAYLTFANPANINMNTNPVVDGIIRDENGEPVLDSDDNYTYDQTLSVGDEVVLTGYYDGDSEAFYGLVTSIVKQSYEITYQATVKVNDSNMGSATLSVMENNGESVTATALSWVDINVEPNEGYEVSMVKVNGVILAKSPIVSGDGSEVIGDGYTFQMDGNTTVEVTFAAIA